MYAVYMYYKKILSLIVIRSCLIFGLAVSVRLVCLFLFLSIPDTIQVLCNRHGI